MGRDPALHLLYPNILRMNRLLGKIFEIYGVLLVSIMLCCNLLDVSAQKTFYTCKEITVDELHAKLEAFPNLVIIDIRSKEEFFTKHIPHANWVPDDSSLIAYCDTLDVDQDVFIYDNSDNESIDACLLLSSKGKRSVFHIKGGYEEWEQVGYLEEKSKK